MGNKLKVLYGVQGTGNGHISRSKEIIRKLRENADVDVLVSGNLHEMDIGLEVKFSKNGTGGWFNREGRIDYWSLFKNTSILGMFKDMVTTPVDGYDLIVSDFEPISAWAAWYYDIPSIHISRQIALLDDNVPKPEENSLLAESIIKYWAPCENWIGFHYDNTSPNIFTPVLREEVRSLTVSDEGHYLICLSCYGTEVFLDFLYTVDAKFEVFSKYYPGSEPATNRNVTLHPFGRKGFLEIFASSSGVICNAGFQLTSEALFLGKKMMVIPMQGQYEQLCNAEALSKFGAKVLSGITSDFKEQLKTWIESQSNTKDVHYPDNVSEVAGRILYSH